MTLSGRWLYRYIHIEPLRVRLYGFKVLCTDEELDGPTDRDPSRIPRISAITLLLCDVLREMMHH